MSKTASKRKRKKAYFRKSNKKKFIPIHFNQKDSLLSDIWTQYENDRILANGYIDISLSSHQGFLSFVFSDIVKKYIHIINSAPAKRTSANHPESVATFGYSFYESDYEDLKKDLYSFEERLGTVKITDLDVAVSNGFMLEYQTLSNAFTLKNPTSVNLSHTVSRVYQQWFGNIENNNRTIKTRPSIPGTLLSEEINENILVSDSFFTLGDGKSFPDRIEAHFGRTEGRYGALLRKFMMNDEKSKRRNTVYSIDVEKSIEVLKTLYSRIILSFFISTLALRIEDYNSMDKDRVEHHVIQGMDSEILRRTFTLMYRQWKFVFLNGETEFAFAQKPIRFLNTPSVELDTDFFIPLSRTLGLIVFGKESYYKQSIPIPSFVTNGEHYIKKYLLKNHSRGLGTEKEYYSSIFAKDIIYV